MGCCFTSTKKKIEKPKVKEKPKAKVSKEKK